MEECIEAKVPWCIDIKLRHKAVEDCIDYSNQLLPELSKKLNGIHNEKYPNRFWQMLLGPWLIQFVGLIIDRVHLTKGADAANIKIDKNKNKRIIPTNTYDSLKLPEIHSFNNQILTDIIQAIDNKVVHANLDQIEYTRDSQHYLTKINFSKETNIKKKALNKLSSVFSGRKTIFVSTSSIPIRMHLPLALRVKGFRTISPLRDSASQFSSKINLQLRENIDLSEADLDFSRDHRVENEIYQILTRLIHLYIPVCFVEGFKKLQMSVKKYPKQPGAILIGTELYGRYESFCYWAAICGINGTIINTMQHGGTNANESSSEFSFPEINPYNGFYTWGWKWAKYGIDVNKLIPMPSAFLMNKRKSKISGSAGDYLFVSTCIQPQLRRLSGSEGDPYINEKYKQDQLIFVNTLSKNLQKKLKVRLYKDDLGQNYNEHWEKNFPHIRFDDRSMNFDDSLDKADLYISDHLSTTWLEALSANKPTILFVDKSIYNFSCSSLKYFKYLEDSGILHFSPCDAAMHLENVSDQLEFWWKGQKTQEKLRAFLRVFGNNPTNGLQLWVTELCRLRDSSRLS